MDFLFKQPKIGFKNQQKKSSYRLTGNGRDLFLINAKYVNSVKKKDFNLNFSSSKTKIKYQKTPKIKRYETNGSGRDTYIYSNNGGAYKIDKKLFFETNDFLQNILRQNKTQPQNILNLQTKTIFPKKIVDASLMQKQRILSSKLSVPKKKADFFTSGNNYFVSKSTKHKITEKENPSYYLKTTDLLNEKPQQYSLRKCKSNYSSKTQERKFVISPKYQKTLSHIFKF